MSTPFQILPRAGSTLASDQSHDLQLSRAVNSASSTSISAAARQLRPRTQISSKTVGSYGRQLGRIGDALEVILEACTSSGSET